jgi:RNA polymerase sigma-70 factor (ECF subfamily)
MEKAPTPEALLAHAGFLQALARRLVFDAGQAEDVVQEAYAVALQNRPRRRSHLRAWLAGITRNLAIKSVRGKARRQRREARVARPEAQPAAADVVARLEVQRRVVEEVRRLAEPYRSTIVHRFFDDCPPREIAQRMGVPVKTVDTRLRRALQMLRARLDAAHDGDRRSWSLALAFLVPPQRAVQAGTAAALAGVTMTAKSTLGITAALAITAFVAGWKLMPADVPTERAPLRSDKDLVPRAELERARTALAAEQTAREKLERRLERLAAERPAAEDAEKPAAKEPPAEAADAKRPRFVYAGTSDALRALDWKTIGESTYALPPLLDELRDAVQNGREIPSSVGQIQRWNGPLIGEALKLQARDVPGTGLNGKFTHPSMLVNLIYATLAQSPVPLSEDQARQLDEIGLRFVEEDMRREASYGPATLPLRKVIEETALKDRFFRDVDGILTVEQRDVLHPADSRGYTTGDLFSSGLVWAQLARPLPIRDRADLEKQAIEVVMTSFDLAEDARPTVESIVATWSAGMSDEFLAEPMTTAVRMRIMRVDRIEKVARLTLDLLESLIGQLSFTDEQKANIDATVRVPFRAAD